ncbi:MAG: helicase-associated domain-containing protein, partial [Treponema sp.]|nr:helicase-associated domain-containing protein [Treponema sp.]
MNDRHGAGRPLIVQSDRTLLLDVHAPGAQEAREAIIPFAELEKSPEHIHTYRITSLSLWNAASAGYVPADIERALAAYSRYEVPEGIAEGFADTMSRYGRIRLFGDPGAALDAESELFLAVDDPEARAEIDSHKSLKKWLRREGDNFALRLASRGTVKLELIRLGWPVKDEAPLVDGDPLEIALRDPCLSGAAFAPRDYQLAAARAVLGDGGPGAGYGVVSLPCGSGKTVVGMIVMSMLKTNTLILTTGVAAAHQWIDELLDKTTLLREEIAEYTGDSKAVAPVTVATYQALTWRASKDGEFPHFKVFGARRWGLIIYDEVHLLPAPVFR